MCKIAWIFVLFNFCNVYGFENWISYDRYTVYEVSVLTKQQAQLFYELTSENLDLFEFGTPAIGGHPVQIGVPPEDADAFEKTLRSSDIEFSIYMDNMQDYLDTEAIRLKQRFEDPDLRDFDIEDFNTYEDILAEMENMAARCRSDLGVFCSTITIGTSYEGRDIRMLRIFKVDDQRQAFWIDSGIHSGEWLPIASNLKMLDMMTANYSLDETVTEFIDKYDWYFLPIMNPDGYVHTWSEDRFWRKSRSPNNGSLCNGTDLNRNFDFMWSNAGTSDDPCSNNYGGSGPASEPETQVVQQAVSTLAESILGFVTLHSAAWMWLHPWGHVDEEGECVYAEDDEWMLQISNPAADAAQETFNETVWTRGNTCETIYPASSTTMDWAKGGAGINYTCTPEVRGPFDPSPELIDVSYQEVKNAVIAMVQALEDNPRN